MLNGRTHQELAQDDLDVRLICQNNDDSQPIPPALDGVGEADKEARNVVGEEVLRRQSVS